MITVEHRDGKWRLIDNDGYIAKRVSTGKPIDGSGHETKEKAERQAGYINAALKSREHKHG